MPLSATWEDGGALAVLGGLLLVATVLAVPRLPSQPDTSNFIGLLFSGGGGAATLYAVRRARSKSMPPEAVRRDVRLGKLSAEAARDAYGYEE